MNSINQVSLLPAGCQPWNRDVVATCGNRFSYSATLATYIYEKTQKDEKYFLHSVVCENSKTVTSICWHPSDPDVIGSTSADHSVLVWSIPQQKAIAKLPSLKAIPGTSAFYLGEKDCLMFSMLKSLQFWRYTKNTDLSSPKALACSFNSDIICFSPSPKDSSRILIGHSNGTISVLSSTSKNIKNVLSPVFDDDDNSDSDPNTCYSVQSVSWDPHSIDYALVLRRSHNLQLVTVAAGTEPAVLMTFTLPSAAAYLQAVCWVPGASGMFISGDVHSAVIRVWNVSKSTPIETMKIRNASGFHNLCVIRPSKERERLHVGEGDEAEGEVSDDLMNLFKNRNKTTLPGVEIFGTFRDGGVGIFNLRRKMWTPLQEKGHVETIFDCKFKPDDSRKLATASFDGSVKIWNTDTMKPEFSTKGSEGIIYQISWAPGNIQQLAAATATRGVFILDLDKGRITTRFKELTGTPIHCVVWCPKDAQRILACSKAGFAYIYQPDGKLLLKYSHPQAVYGGDWFDQNLFVTGCEDGNVRVFYGRQGKDKALKVFKGHTKKVFHVRCNAMKEGWVCSGSDDGDVRVWTYSGDTCHKVLRGHTQPVRGLCWNTEIPYVLCSGSWDFTVRVWDVRDGACLGVYTDHAADVYGLSCHPERPFLMASTSRDSTVRLWSLRQLIQPLEIYFLANRPIEQIFSTPESGSSLNRFEHAYRQIGTPLLVSAPALNLRKAIEESADPTTDASVMQTLTDFFMFHEGLTNLWDMVHVVRGRSDLVSNGYENGIVHSQHVSRYKTSFAQKLEMARFTKSGGAIGSATKEDKLKDAAQRYIKLGNIQKYCQLMIELGEWEKALSLAPAVSHEYWNSIMIRYSELMTTAEPEAALPFCVATGNVEKVVSFLSDGGDLSDAFVATVMASEGAFTSSAAGQSNVNNSSDGSQDGSQYEEKVGQAAVAMATTYFREGRPVLAACCYLAVSKIQEAVMSLIRAHELELAICVGRSLPGTEHLVSMAATLLAKRCEKSGSWELAIDLLRHLGCSQQELTHLCIRCNCSQTEADSLYKKVGLPPLSECEAKAEETAAGQDRLEMFLLSRNPSAGLQEGLKYVKAQIESSDFVLDDIESIMAAITCTRLEKLPSSKNTMKIEVQALGAYTGALLALRAGYTCIVGSLLRIILDLMTRQTPGCVHLPWTRPAMEEFVVAVGYGLEGSNTEMQEDHRRLFSTFCSQAGVDPDKCPDNEMVVTASRLPSNSSGHQSCISGRKITGPVFYLEDGETCMSLNEALMWAKVYPYSPLNSAQMINPF